MIVRREFTAQAAPVPPILRGRRTSAAEADHTILVRLNDHRRRMTPAEAEAFGRALLAAAEAGRDMEAATWTL